MIRIRGYRGQPLVALSLVLGGWVALRAMVWDAGMSPAEAQPFAPVLAGGTVAADRADGFAGGIETVQAIRFRRRAGIAVDDHPKARVATRARQRGQQGGSVVAIAADVEAQTLLRPGLERMRDHCTNHFRLLPGRDQHRDAPRKRPGFHPGRKPPGTAAASQAQPNPGEIDDEFVYRANNEPEACEQQQFAFDELQHV